MRARARAPDIQRAAYSMILVFGDRAKQHDYDQQSI
jgi:hypothetical protein